MNSERIAMRSEYINKKDLARLLAALQPMNRLACRVALETGLRIGDVLQLRTVQLRRRSMSVKEDKTDKVRTVTLSDGLRSDLRAICGSKYVFAHRSDQERHRSRTTVYKDMRKAAAAVAVKKHASPHSLRKVFAVELYRATGDLEVVQKVLNHDRKETTVLYALADVL